MYPAFVPRAFVCFPLPGLRLWTSQPCHGSGPWERALGSLQSAVCPYLGCSVLLGVVGWILEGQHRDGLAGEFGPTLWTPAWGSDSVSLSPEQGPCGGEWVGQGSVLPAQLAGHAQGDEWI